MLRHEHGACEDKDKYKYKYGHAGRSRVCGYMRTDRGDVRVPTNSTRSLPCRLAHSTGTKAGPPSSLDPSSIPSAQFSVLFDMGI